MHLKLANSLYQMRVRGQEDDLLQHARCRIRRLALAHLFFKQRTWIHQFV